MVPRIVHVHVLRRPPATPGVALRRASFASQLEALRRAARPATTRPEAAPSPAPTAAWRNATPVPARAEIAPWLTTPARRVLADEIATASREAGVAPELALAVAVAESSLERGVPSADGLGRGVFQVTDRTAADIRRRFAEGRLERPRASEEVALGIAHLRYLDRIFAKEALLGAGLETVAVHDPVERTSFALAAYNAGEGRVAAAQRAAAALRRDPRRYESIRPFLPATTRTYVERVLRYAGRARPTRSAA